MNKMRINIILLLFVNIAICSVIIEKTESEIKEYFPNALSIKWKMHKIQKSTAKNIQNVAKQKFFRKEVNTWMIVDSDSSKYYAILDNVKGKSLPITFLTIFNSDLNLEHSSIIKYREAYGGEVGSRSGLDQFSAYNDTSDYSVGSSISGISGATISVHSVSKGIRKLSMLIDEIIRDYNYE